MNEIVHLSEYREWLHHLKQQFRSAQVKASLSVNSQNISFYFDLGRQITEKLEIAKWGSAFVEQLSKDLRKEFPDVTGFSRTNLFRMKRFYNFYAPLLQRNEFVPQPVGQISDSIVPQPVG
jgi:hypothetical protein